MASPLDPCDPDHERFDALAWAVVRATLAITVAVLGAAVLGWNGSVAGWLLLAAAVPVALVPIARWRWRVADEERLPVGHLDGAWRSVLEQAASATGRLEAAAAMAAPGAVADHLVLLHHQARLHLRQLHRSAELARPLDPAAGRLHLDDARAVARRLGELADAGDRLLAAQQRPLGADPLGELVQRTDDLTEVLRRQVLAAGSAAATAGGAATPAPLVPAPPPPSERAGGAVDAAGDANGGPVGAGRPDSAEAT